MRIAIAIEELETLKGHVIVGKVAAVRDFVQAAIDRGVDPAAMLDGALVPAMAEVGERMAKGQTFIPEVLLSAKAMYAGLDLIKPLVAASALAPRATVVIGTVKGDLHDIGKGLVSMIMEGAGIRVVDLGKNVPPEHFVNAVKELKPNVVGMSAMLTTTMPHMGATIDALRTEHLRDDVKVIIGGAPLTPTWAEKIGADGYGHDASAAVALVHKLLGIHA